MSEQDFPQAQSPQPVPQRAVIGSRIPTQWPPLTEEPKIEHAAVNEMPDIALEAVEAAKRLIGSVGEVAATGSVAFDPVAGNALKKTHAAQLRRGRNSR